MSTVAEFLNNLRARDIKIWVEDDRLRINAPKGAIDEALKVELGQRKSEVIAYLNATSTTQSRNTAPLIPVDRSTPPPLSFTQQRLWFLDQMEPDSTTFSLPVTMRLTGVLNVAALEESIRRIVQRHEVLRTTFSQENGRPVQIIHPTIDDYLTQIDLSSYPAHEHLDMAVNLIEADFDQPFDLANDQLIRSKLFKLAETDHILLISLHHIITDRWSIALMWHELTSIYNELVTGKQSSLPHLPIQYADYAAWQQLWLESEDYQAQLAYWQKQLSGTLPTFDLPLDHPRPVHAANRGGTFQRILPADLVQKIRQISQAHGATLYMTMLAALKTLLFRYTGQEDLLIGTSIANRNHEEIINLIGFFVNTLLLRTDLSGQPSFLALLDRVKQVTLDAFANQDMPVEKLIELLHPNRDGGQAALFDVLFIFQNTPDAEGELAHIKTDPFPLDFERAMFDLTWYVVEQAEGLEIDIEYDADLFERSTIDRLVTHFQCLLESIAAAPHEPISLLAMLPTQEQAVLAEWGHGKSVPLPSGCVHHWFEAQAAAIPDKTAVSHQSQQLSYAQLNARANQLAHYLIEKGIAPDTIVGLHVPRSIEMIVALLGILKAGGAYLPLDPTYPESRLQFMVEDAQPAVILALGDLSFALPDGQAAQIVQLGDTRQFESYPEHDPVTAVSQNHLAYIIYTSGSTGKPKGVQIEHGAMATFVQGAVTDYPITGNDRVLQFATIAFDTAVEEIFPCLTQGGTLVLRTETMIDTMDNFLKKCAEWGITVLDLPTAFWHHLTASLTTDQLTLPDSVKLVLIGGEKANEQALNEWQKNVNSDVRLLNTYGPTEATVVTTMFEAKAGHATETISKGVLIGRPLPNYDIYVLDAALQPVPIGITGELMIGGPGLARGYLNRPELTDEKFIKNPFGNGRLYRTGDLVNFLPDGNLEFMGRSDDQVKIRGYRIELGEIEAALTQHPLIQQTIVIAYEPATGDRQLAAYLIAHEDIQIDQLHEYLLDTLPAYMIPASFTLLDALPLMPNGKVDRKALPSPDLTRNNLDAQFVAPRNPVEEAVSLIMAEVLNLDKVGVMDNFFMIGGHSLLATRVLARISETFKFKLTLRDFFDLPTIAHLAEILVSDPTQRQRIEKTAVIHVKLANLTDEEIAQMLQAKSKAQA